MSQIKINEFDISKISLGPVRLNKWNKNWDKRFDILYDQDNNFVVETDNNIIVKFLTKYPNTTDDKYTLAVENNDLTNLIGNTLVDTLCTLVSDQSESIFGSEKDFDLCKDTFKNPVSFSEEYSSLLNASFYSNNINELFIDSEQKQIENPNVNELLKNRTKIRMILSMPYLTIKGDTIRPLLSVKRIQIIEQESDGLQSISMDEYESSRLTTGKLIVTDRGGKKTYANYNGARFAFTFNDVTLAYTQNGILDKKFNEEDPDRYGLNISLKDGLEGLFTQVDTDLKERILDKSVEYLGKKYVSYKKKGTATKMIDNMYSGHCYYSKKVREAMKNGETPEYPPTLHVELPKYDGTFSCKFLEQTEDGGLQPFAGDFDEYVRNNNCLQSLTIACRHIWFGTKVSIKWVVTELVVNPVNKVEQVFKFSDEMLEPVADDIHSDTEEDDNDEDDNDEDLDEELNDDTEVLSE